MALSLVRADSHAVHEVRFLKEKRVFLTWDGLKIALAPATLIREFWSVVMDKEGLGRSEFHDASVLIYRRRCSWLPGNCNRSR
jgi:hypothetical protein